MKAPDGTGAAFGSWLRDSRKAAGISQDRLAKLMRDQGFTGWYQTTAAKTEAATRPVRLDEAAALCGLLGGSVDLALGLRPDTADRSALASRCDFLRQIREQLSEIADSIDVDP